ncbi:AEC family transporter [Xenorhabdus indica]|uniref:AEC family transporter n=1 Tax=Xenorhabdus indica TaxID=333964 RepID=UPI0030B8A844
MPLCNAISILALTPNKKALSIKQFVMVIIKNPLIIACFIGISFNLTKIGLPYGSGQFLKILASASLPLGLICIGASLQPSTLRSDKNSIIINILSRLLLMPLIAGIIGFLFHLNILELNLLILFFAIPTAPTAYILTRQLNGDSQLMSAIITLQTITAVITLPIILSLELN